MVRLLVCNHPRYTIQEVGEEAYRQHFGMLVVPFLWSTPVTVSRMGVPWAIDNYAFSGFDPGAFCHLLQRWQGLPGCRWVAAPDVVGNAQATMERFNRWHGFISKRGYPVALVAQDGLEDLSIPWDKIACLFIGGTTEWKLSSVTADIVKEAKTRGKWVHLGRVNTVRRLRYAQNLNCDSADGSAYARFKSHTRKHLPVLQSRQPYLLEAS